MTHALASKFYMIVKLQTSRRFVFSSTGYGQWTVDRYNENNRGNIQMCAFINIQINIDQSDLIKR